MARNAGHDGAVREEDRRARQLAGARVGHDAADLVVRLTDAVVGTDVVEVELNPVLVGTTGATAVDALLIVEQH